MAAAESRGQVTGEQKPGASVQVPSAKHSEVNKLAAGFCTSVECPSTQVYEAISPSLRTSGLPFTARSKVGGLPQETGMQDIRTACPRLIVSNCPLSVQYLWKDVAPLAKPVTVYPSEH